MIKTLKIVVQDNHNPYFNLALEQRLISRVEHTECILYLWQCAHTVVIGKNQNAWKECHVDQLHKDQGILARRYSGGGAVYQDLGNLNFTFIAYKENYDVVKQLSVIQHALKELGIEVEISGRNDVCVMGRKISGNAFSHTPLVSCHHGTLLIDVDTKKMQKYLNPSIEKLQSKGVDSVRSRVANLKEFYPTITVKLLIEKIVMAFEKVYKLPSINIAVSTLIDEQFKQHVQHLSSEAWILGVKIPFRKEISTRFSWGELQIYFDVNKGIIQEYQVYCDALELNFIEELKSILKDCPYNVYEVTKRVSTIKVDEQLTEMKNDVLDWLNKEGL